MGCTMGLAKWIKEDSCQFFLNDKKWKHESDIFQSKSWNFSISHAQKYKPNSNSSYQSGNLPKHIFLSLVWFFVAFIFFRWWRIKIRTFDSHRGEGTFLKTSKKLQKTKRAGKMRRKKFIGLILILVINTCFVRVTGSDNEENKQKSQTEHKEEDLSGKWPIKSH